MMKRQIKIVSTDFRYRYPDPIIIGDVNAYEIVFTSNEDMTGYIMSVKAKRVDGSTVEDTGFIDGKVATYTLKNNMYSLKGKLEIWVAITSESGDYITRGLIEADVDTSGDEPTISGDDRVPALTQLIINVQAINEVATAAAEEAKTSETNAKNSETVVTQTMSDMLAMMGTDIATLDSSGKIPVGQIPPIALTHTYTVGSVEEMQALTAEDGDFCRIVIDGVVDGTYAYVVSGDTGDWIPCNQNKCAEADHALAADTAENATKINGHRIVVFDNMTDFNNAVKADGVLYLVGEVV